MAAAGTAARAGVGPEAGTGGRRAVRGEAELERAALLRQPGLIERLAEPLRAVNAHWPEPHFIYRGEPIETLAEKFIANLYPPPKQLLAAHLAWFDALFAQPARAAGKAISSSEP